VSLAQTPASRTTLRVAVTSLITLVAVLCAPLSPAQADEGSPDDPRISGTVTAGSQPASDVHVVAYDAQGEYVNGRWTDRDGTYELSVPANASYRLEISDPERQIFRTEYWQDQPTLATATPIAVGAGDVPDTDAVLARNPQIRGTVTDENLQEIEGVDIDVFRWVNGSYREIGRFQSGVDGRYRAPVEAGGKYKLRFQHSDYRTEWFDDAVAEADAKELPVTATMTGADVRLAQRPAITGVVAGPSGPVQCARVTAYQEGPFGSWPEVGSTSTGADGSYALGLEPGQYRIGFDGGQALATEYYEDSSTLASSTPVVLTTSGRRLDATLDASPVIRGTVRSDVGGTPLAGIHVSAAVRKDYSDGPYWQTQSSAVTQGDGSYTLPVPEGTYRLQFSGGSTYRSEYHGDTTDEELATELVVDATGATVDASLAPHPTVSGVITAAGGAALPDIQVSLATQIAPGEWRTFVTGRTALDGSYSIGVPPGTYRLRFRDDKNGRYRTEYLDNSPTKPGATLIEIAGEDVDGLDAELVAQAAVTGTVTGPGGAVAADVIVTAYDLSDDSIDQTGTVASTTTSATGTYSLALEDGTYRLEFRPRTLSLRPEFWEDAASWNEARDVVVDGSVVTGVDAELAVGSGVTGTVSVPGEQRRVYVAFYTKDADGSWTFFSEVESSHGVFDASLPSGTYRVKYQADGFAPIYHGASATFGGAADVVISEGQTRYLGDTTFGAHSAVINVVPPSVGGAPTVGSTLTADQGQWGPASSPVSLSRQWLRDGEPIDGATGRNYALVQDDVGARIAVQVKGVQEGLLSRSKTSAPTAQVTAAPAVTPPVVQPTAPPVLAKASVKVIAKGARKKASLTITVKASGVTPTGRVTIRLGSRTLKTVTLKGGKATVTLTKQKKGKRTYKIAYSGDSKVRAKSTTSVVRIK
jgi:5-hydroxyisourate hydrolase-like protein (transthyretin family)